MSNGPAAKTAKKLMWHEAVLADPELPLNSKVVAGWLMHRFTKNLDIVIAEDTIAQDLSWSLSTVKRALSSLKRNWLAVGRRGACNMYRPIFDRVPLIKDRLVDLRSARANARAEREARSFQVCTVTRVNSDPHALSDKHSIPSIEPSKYTQKKGHSMEDVDGGRRPNPHAFPAATSPLPAVPNFEAAKSELVQLLGRGDNRRGAVIARSIGPRRLESLAQLLQDGELYLDRVAAAARSVAPCGDLKSFGEEETIGSLPEIFAE